MESVSQGTFSVEDGIKREEDWYPGGCSRKFYIGGEALPKGLTPYPFMYQV